MNQLDLQGAVKRWRVDEERLREELHAYEPGTARVRRSGVDITPRWIDTIKGEITSIERAVQFLTATFGGPYA